MKLIRLMPRLCILMKLLSPKIEYPHANQVWFNFEYHIMDTCLLLENYMEYLSRQGYEINQPQNRK